MAILFSTKKETMPKICVQQRTVGFTGDGGGNFFLRSEETMPKICVFNIVPRALLADDGGNNTPKAEVVVGLESERSTGWAPPLRLLDFT